MKYETALHQNVSVWARRARLNMNGIDLDAVVRSTEKHLGNGRRAALRWVAIEALRTSDLLKSKQFTAHCLGMAIGDMVYDVAYGNETIATINAAKLEGVISKYEGTVGKIGTVMQYADVAVAMAVALVEARAVEKVQAKRSLVSEVLRKVRGA